MALQDGQKSGSAARHDHARGSRYVAEALRKWMTRERLTQAQAAKRLGVVQPYVSEITCNKVDKLSLDYLVGLCAKAGLTVAVRLVAYSYTVLQRPAALIAVPTSLALCSEQSMACDVGGTRHIRLLRGSV